MKKIITTAAVIAAATVAAGCGSHTAAPPAPKNTTPAAAAPVSPSPASTSQAAANERAFADAMSAGTITIQPQLVSGPVMTAYFQYEVEASAALSAAGSPRSGDSVTEIPGGWKLCDNTNSCQSLTDFTTNAGGQITGLSVDGQTVAGRLGTGPDSSVNGVQVSGVTAYKVTDAQNTTSVCFQVHDVSYTDPAYQPAATATLATPAGTVADGIGSTYSALLPQRLSAGTTVSSCAIFGTTAITGTLQLASTSDGRCWPPAPSPL